MALRPKTLVRDLLGKSRLVQSCLVQSCLVQSCLVQPWNPSLVRLHKTPPRPFLWMVLFTLVIACALPSAPAQTDLNDVHIQPREATPHDAEKTRTKTEE